MAFKGMDPAEGAEIAQAVGQTSEQVLEAIGDVTNLVNSVEWVGPDYEAYREDWNAFLSGPVDQLVNGLQTKGNELSQHAEEQTQTSNQQ